jgi:hypothetical protein
MVGVEAFRLPDVLRIPAIPLSRLVTAEQHDSVLVGVEREQHSRAPVNPGLLELVDAGAVDHIDVWSPRRGTALDDPLDGTIDLLLAVRRQVL